MPSRGYNAVQLITNHVCFILLLDAYRTIVKKLWPNFPKELDTSKPKITDVNSVVAELKLGAESRAESGKTNYYREGIQAIKEKDTHMIGFKLFLFLMAIEAAPPGHKYTKTKYVYYDLFDLHIPLS